MYETEIKEIGALGLVSGSLRLLDPVFFTTFVVNDLPIGRWPLFASIISFPEGGVRIASVLMRLKEEESTHRSVLGEIGTDSACVALLDGAAFDNDWQEPQAIVGYENWCEALLALVAANGFVAELSLNDAKGANVLGVSSGYGTGTYKVLGHYARECLVAIEVEFIGPSQDRLLSLFPALRF